MRIGFGYDIHKLVEGRDLVLGGIKIPYSRGLLGHSDADVLLHAVCDALLGAAALGDIGKHFPDNDRQYENISSLVLLKKVILKIKEAGYKVVNIDSTIIAEEPKMNPHIPAMIKTISEAISISEDKINIKATTNEGLGAVGRKEGIAAHAVALIN